MSSYFEAQYPIPMKKEQIHRGTVQCNVNSERKSCKPTVPIDEAKLKRRAMNRINLKKTRERKKKLYHQVSLTFYENTRLHNEMMQILTFDHEKQIQEVNISTMETSLQETMLSNNRKHELLMQSLQFPDPIVDSILYDAVLFFKRYIPGQDYPISAFYNNNATCHIRGYGTLPGTFGSFESLASIWSLKSLQFETITLLDVQAKVAEKRKMVSYIIQGSYMLYICIIERVKVRKMCTRDYHQSIQIEEYTLFTNVTCTMNDSGQPIGMGIHFISQQ